MKTKELLKPRYKVIADYPQNQRMVGSVIESLPNEADQLELERQMALYPHLFKKLEWWEERSVNELPKYFRNSNGVHETAGRPIEEYAKHNFVFLPATEQEFLNQQK